MAHRASADPRIRVFDRIAWIYGRLFRLQRSAFRRSWRRLQPRLELPDQARILDIGCGSGAHLSVLAEMGHEVWGVDFSPGMVAVAKSLLGRSGLEREAARVSRGDPLRGLEFPSGWFDLVIASHVVHGMRAASRRRFYREARRVSRGPVLFFDYSPRELRGPRIVTRVLEALERSDYRDFRRGGGREMRELFATVELLPASPGSVWYLCRASTGSPRS